jgi:hypothetical protein
MRNLGQFIKITSLEPAWNSLGVAAGIFYRCGILKLLLFGKLNGFPLGPRHPPQTQRLSRIAHFGRTNSIFVNEINVETKIPGETRPAHAATVLAAVRIANSSASHNLEGSAERRAFRFQISGLPYR